MKKIRLYENIQDFHENYKPWGKRFFYQERMFVLKESSRYHDSSFELIYYSNDSKIVVDLEHDKFKGFEFSFVYND